MTLHAKASDTAAFILQALLHPRRFGAVLPSSRRLGQRMASYLSGAADQFVLELGPGTGVITEALIRRGVPPGNLVAIEQCPVMAARLRRRFPEAQVIVGDAFKLGMHLERRVDPAVRFHVVCSSLPLLFYPESALTTLAQQLTPWLHPGARLLQYTYSLAEPQGPTLGQRLASEIVWINLPPARVDVYLLSAHPARKPVYSARPRPLVSGGFAG